MDGEKKDNLIERLAGFLPATSILASREELGPYECDGLSVYRQLPALVVLPETVEQVAATLKLCHAEKVEVVARGAGTGLSGGAMPLADAVVLSLAKFNQILSINSDNRTAVVQPGVRNLAISQAVDHLGFYYAPDPSSQIACTIGGNVAENSGGVHCLKYGLTVHNVQGLKMLSMEGELIELGGAALDTPGYDFLALMHGSEGLLGVIVEVTVKLLPKPEVAQVVMAAFDDIEKAGQGVADIIAAGIVPAGLEMMDRLAISAAEAFAHAGYPTDAEAILLCELDGTLEGVGDHIAAVQQVLREAGATAMKTSANEAERLQLWAGRKAAFPAVGRLAPDYYCMDGTIPKSALANVLRRIAEWSEEYNLPVANVFHAGDGNMHPLILYDANKPGELERTEEFGAKILELCVVSGGSITGEHGVGMEKLDSMCVQFGALELAQFFAVKDAFDPDRLLNPGKAVPTLHRCAELGRMHVHNGELPHPELERF
ncbi:FAD-binding protein [Mariprofundus sp. NF]|uniref:FAD-linked oxidase C-terminal domain-containing protein n=1 Tax=Mariprofundus sp. NF TaxID=2608716 RepID=UPI0015A00CE7|nr:FAD-linked oxidase C-terminal domain-containing protein [Mariprofundus sp. NF]NWF39240.1 FAD-binding protein [Mariprofundus sp. NF]